MTSWCDPPVLKGFFPARTGGVLFFKEKIANENFDQLFYSNTQTLAFLNEV